MLIGNVLIDSDENVEAGGLGSVEKLAILQSCQIGETRRLAEAASTIQQQLLRFFQHFERKNAGNGWEAFQKILQRVAAPQVIEKSLDRHARPSKHGDTVHRIGIYCDSSHHVFIVTRDGRIQIKSRSAYRAFRWFPPDRVVAFIQPIPTTTMIGVDNVRLAGPLSQLGSGP